MQRSGSKRYLVAVVYYIFRYNILMEQAQNPDRQVIPTIHKLVVRKGVTKVPMIWQGRRMSRENAMIEIEQQAKRMNGRLRGFVHVGSY